MDFLGSSLGWRTVLLSTSTVDIGVKKSFKIKRLSIYQSHKYTDADESFPVLANIFYESLICVIRNILKFHQRYCEILLSRLLDISDINI